MILRGSLVLIGLSLLGVIDSATEFLALVSLAFEIIWRKNAKCEWTQSSCYTF